MLRKKAVNSLVPRSVSLQSSLSNKRKLPDYGSPNIIVVRSTMRQKKGKEKVAEDYESLPTEPKLGFCKLCKEDKRNSFMFRKTTCPHSFCFDCTRQHIATKMKENFIQIPCPEANCKSLIIPEICESLLPIDVIRRWESALRYSRTPPIRIFHCPHCSTRLKDEGMDLGQNQYENCPRCSKQYCAACLSFSHEGLTCEEARKELVKQEEEEEDFHFIMLMLGKEENWKICPKCKIFAGSGKANGSDKVECWCKYKFCYECESEWSPGHTCFN